MKTISKTDMPAALLVLLFSYAAASKLADTGKFRGQLYLQPFPHALSDALVYALPVIELAVVALLLADRTRKAGLIAALALLTAFTVYISMGLLHVWKRVPCSCGGILEHMGWGQHLAFNWVFMIINILGLCFGRREQTALT
ncbi:MauE/DoxX family redox-associated membrane protein [Mucilaginibacter oryzae]|uniref:MauE/DoxX family redox-associated membrane protein n=1 Tax=Mucilaginibacter oryzae TaxID=468058 RepID=UPI000D6D7022|nr:MauE/DoxX family redox-associated membrane protein [Mucilaginibacter oryzae]